MTVTDAPTPRRVRRPRWLDARVIGGVVLLIASVLIGAKVVGAARHTSPVWAAAHDLAAGTVLQDDDLIPADVNLGERAGEYVDAGSSPAGRLLASPVRAGELVPAAAIGQVDDGRIVSIAVAPDRIAPGVRHGSVIDLYLTTGTSARVGEDVVTRVLQSGVTVQSVTAPASGGLSAVTSGRYQIALLLSPTDAESLVRTLPTGEPLVVLRTGGPGAAPGRGDVDPPETALPVVAASELTEGGPTVPAAVAEATTAPATPATPTTPPAPTAPATPATPTTPPATTTPATPALATTALVTTTRSGG